MLPFACAHTRRFLELRREIGANPGNAGVQPGATSLVFRRGVCFWADAPLQAQSDKRAPSLRAGFSRGERAGGSGAKWFSVQQYGKCFFLKSLLHLTEFTINCNRRYKECGKQRVSGAVISPS